MNPDLIEEAINKALQMCKEELDLKDKEIEELRNHSQQEKNESFHGNDSSSYKYPNTDETGFSLPKSCSDGLGNKTADTNNKPKAEDEIEKCKHVLVVDDNDYRIHYCIKCLKRFRRTDIKC